LEDSIYTRDRERMYQYHSQPQHVRAYGAKYCLSTTAGHWKQSAGLDGRPLCATKSTVAWVFEFKLLVIRHWINARLPLDGTLGSWGKVVVGPHGRNISTLGVPTPTNASGSTPPRLMTVNTSENPRTMGHTMHTEGSYHASPPQFSANYKLKASF